MVAAAGGRVGCASQRLIDRFQYSRKIAIDVAIPKSQNAKAGLLERVVAARVTQLVRTEVVLAAVDFDNQLMLHTDEVHDKAFTRRLSAKVKAARTP
jgi:hypothetical protein